MPYTRYLAFGLSITSDIALSECLIDHRSTSADVSITSTAHLNIEKNDSQTFFFSIKNTGNFLIKNGREIYYEKMLGVEDKKIVLFLLGSCMGALLQQRGHIVLHGNAISYDQKNAEIFVGQSGAGKSTLAAWHYQQGASILADDVCLLTRNANQTVDIIPSYPQLKLWKTTADMLEIETDSLENVFGALSKYRLPIKDKFYHHPLPVKKITIINPTLKIKRHIKGFDKFHQLFTHNYRYQFLSQMGIDQIYYQKFLSFIASIEVYESPRMEISLKNANVPTTV